MYKIFKTHVKKKSVIAVCPILRYLILFNIIVYIFNYGLKLMLEILWNNCPNLFNTQCIDTHTHTHTIYCTQRAQVFDVRSVPR